MREIARKLIDKGLEYRMGAVMMAQSWMSQLAGIFPDSQCFIDCYRSVVHDGVPGKLILPGVIAVYIAYAALFKSTKFLVDHPPLYEPHR